MIQTLPFSLELKVLCNWSSISNHAQVAAIKEWEPDGLAVEQIPTCPMPLCMHMRLMSMHCGAVVDGQFGSSSRTNWRIRPTHGCIVDRCGGGKHFLRELCTNAEGRTRLPADPLPNILKLPGLGLIHRNLFSSFWNSFQVTRKPQEQRNHGALSNTSFQKRYKASFLFRLRITLLSAMFELNKSMTVDIR